MLLDFVPDLYESCFITNVTVRWIDYNNDSFNYTTAFLWIVLTFNILHNVNKISCIFYNTIYNSMYMLYMYENLFLLLKSIFSLQNYH